jgi:hypothetical protein
VQQRLEADRQDPPFVGMMSNGTSGNINNVNFRGDPARATRRTYEQMRFVADVVAKSAVEAVKKIEYRDHVSLAAKAASLTLGVRKPSPKDIERAEGILSRAAPGVELRSEWVYARETMALTKYPDQVELTVQALKIGDLAVAAIPCEVFVEIGLELKSKSPIKPMFTISLANGYNGYLPTPEHHALGGYETWRARSSYLEVGASPVITAKLLELLGELNRP